MHELYDPLWCHIRSSFLFFFLLPEEQVFNIIASLTYGGKKFLMCPLVVNLQITSNSLIKAGARVSSGRKCLLQLKAEQVRGEKVLQKEHLGFQPWIP